VAIFAKANEGDVDRRCFQELGVTIHLGAQIEGVALQVVCYAWMHFFFEPSPNPVSETGRMIRLDPGVFVHMEKLDSFPIDVLLDQGIGDWNLGIPGGRDDSCSTLLSDGALDDLGSLLGRRASGCRRRAVHLNSRLAISILL
jgi:hypothetical protein